MTRHEVRMWAGQAEPGGPLCVRGTRAPAPPNGIRPRLLRLDAILAASVFALAGLSLSCSGGGSDTGGSGADAGGASNSRPQAQDTRGQVPPPPPGSGSGATGMNWTAPAGWVEQQPTSSMRKAQFQVPGSGGAAELVVFYFGPNQGGDAMSNATRWAGQFQTPEGAPAVDQMKTEQREFGGMKTLLTEVEGVYRNTMVSPEAFPNYKLLGAVVEGPDANWFFKLTGPAATIEENRDAFLTFLGSLRPGS